MRAGTSTCMDAERPSDWSVPIRCADTREAVTRRVSLSVDHRLECLDSYSHIQILKAGGVDFEDERLSFEEWGKVNDVEIPSTF